LSVAGKLTKFLFTFTRFAKRRTTLVLPLLGERELEGEGGSKNPSPLVPLPEGEGKGKSFSLEESAPTKSGRMRRK